MTPEKRITMLEKRVEELEAKLKPLWEATRCPYCENAAAEEHQCYGDYNDSGKHCRCCSGCSLDCAQSV